MANDKDTALLKRCSKCLETKTTSEFHKQRSSPQDGLAVWCKVCKRSNAKEWAVAHPEQRKATSGAYREANREILCAISRKYHAEHREAMNASTARRQLEHWDATYAQQRAWRKSNSDKNRAHQSRWRRANRPACQVHLANRRAREATAPGRGVSSGEWRQILVESLGLCAYCNQRKPLTMDHIDPISRLGAHDIDNIVATCRSCNSSKCDTSLLVWLARKAA